MEHMLGYLTKHFCARAAWRKFAAWTVQPDFVPAALTLWGWINILWMNRIFPVQYLKRASEVRLQLFFCGKKESAEVSPEMILLCCTWLAAADTGGCAHPIKRHVPPTCLETSVNPGRNQLCVQSIKDGYCCHASDGWHYLPGSQTQAWYVFSS